MPNHQGEFIWYELCTDDADAAQAFYSRILGWKITGSGQADMDYRILTAADAATGEETHIGGLLQLAPEMKHCGARPVWLGYIAVDDVDRAVAAITGAGGSVQMAAKDVPHVGRIAMVADPQGTPFYVMRGASDGISMAFASDRPRIGHCAWNELLTPDPAAAKAFYFGHFGWAKAGEMDMGSLGSYEFIRHTALEHTAGDFKGVIGAIMPKPVEMPAPLWHYYFRVADIDLALESISLAGGQVLQGPDEIPGGEFTVLGTDPQGAVFALVGVRNRQRTGETHHA